MISKIRRVRLREVWAHEATDFTTYLENNIDVLNDTLDLSLTSVEREQTAGAFSVDLVAEDENGQLITGELMDYAIPRATGFPMFKLDRTETPTEVNPLGVKGVGEAGTIGSTPAVVNAVVDALHPFGVTHVDMPLKPEKIWRLIQERRAS